MLTRLEIATTLYNDGESPSYTPQHPKYSYHVEKLIIKKHNINCESLSNTKESAIQNVAKSFAWKTKLFYGESGKHVPRMLKKKKAWFSQEIKNPIENIPDPKKPQKRGPKKKNRGGAPKKDYSKSKDRSQRDKATKMATNPDNSLDKLLHASIIAAKKEGNKDAAWALKFLKSNPTVNGSLFRQTMKNTLEPITAYSPEECLATIIELKLTQKAYRKLRRHQRNKKANLYVTWDKILAVKKESQPDKIDDSKPGEVSSPMQSVVDHQAKNIMELPDVKEKYQKILDSGREHKLTLFGKYGTDGTQSKSDWHTTDSGTY